MVKLMHMTNETISPEPRLKSSPQDVFMHLLAIATLYVSIISFITLWFQYINVLLPDPLNFFYRSALDGVRWASSALVVVFPVFILLSWLIGRDFRAEPKKRELRVRKWLLYFTLFIAAITIIVDLVTLFFNFYSGELTTQFILKILVVLLVAVAVFGYHLWDVRRSAAEQSRRPRQLAWVVIFAVAASIVIGFFIVGSPAKQRSVRFDEQRISDLQTLQGEVVNYWTMKEKLPQSIDNLRDSISGFVPPSDPKTGAVYQYRIKSSLSFELCATFETKSLDLTGRGNDQLIPKPASFPGGSYLEPYQQNWQHEIGQVCFERTIDPELYKKPGK